MARAGVDFFVCLLYMLILLLISGAATMSAYGISAKLVTLSVIAVVSTIFCYRAAVTATDIWAAAVRAMIDVGRIPLSKALGLTVPATLERERAMWEAVGWFLTFSYESEAASYLDPFRARPKDSEVGADGTSDAPGSDGTRPNEGD
jgi:hypothetical protein